VKPERRSIPGLAEQLGELRSSLAGDPSPRNVMRVAEAYWLAGLASDAAQLLEPLVRDSPNAIAPRLLLGWCYQDCGLADLSRESFEAARTLDPANPFLKEPSLPREPSPPRVEVEPIANLEAIAEPEAALTPEELRSLPPFPLYSGTLGQIFESQGFEEKAIEIYREVLRMNPERGDLLARIEALEARAWNTG
jgi:tetratricopeptide (TPR) repeat protein